MQKHTLTFAQAQNDIRGVFERIESGALRRTSEARSELEKIERRMDRSNRTSVYTAKFVSELMEMVRNARDAQRRARLIYALAFLSFRIKITLHEALFDFMVEQILHDDAHVRLAAVNMAESLRTDMYVRDIAKRERLWVSRVSRIAELVHERMPTEWRERDAFDPVYVRILPASQLKSLLLLWKACAYVGTESEAWHERHPECALGFPVEWWDDPNMADIEDEEEELPTREEVAEGMWNTPPSERVRNSFVALAAMTEERFRTALERTGIFDQAIANDIESLKRREDGARVETLITRMHAKMKERGGTFEDVNPLIRELQGFWNHIARMDARGDPLSYFAITCLRTRNANGRAEPRNVGGIIPLLADAHRAIDSFGEQILDKRRAADAELLAWMREYFPEDRAQDSMENAHEYSRSFEPRVWECLSIAHHALDWYVAAEPWRFEKKQAEKWAAIALDMVRWTNEGSDAGRYRWLPYDRKELGAFGGWKGSIGYGALSAWAVVRDNVHDPDLLLLSPDETDKDIEHDLRSH